MNGLALVAGTALNGIAGLSQSGLRGFSGLYEGSSIANRVRLKGFVSVVVEEDVE